MKYEIQDNKLTQEARKMAPFNSIRRDQSQREGNTPCFFSLPPQQFTLLAVLLGFALASNLSLDQQSSFGNFLQAMGQVIITINAQGSTLQAQQDDQQIAQQIELLKKQINLLELQLKERF
ncbi:MAG: hypothetical protein PWR27_2361 [Petroclostridium sp.]|jgi:hypothetical protein|nr:hypothetical protein [Petroclostridium sp.]